MHIKKLIKNLDNLNEKLSQEDIDKMTDEEIEAKYEENYQNFITGLENLSKKYGIVMKGTGCFPIWSVNGLKEVEYDRDSSSGDLCMLKVTNHDGTDMIKWWEKNYC